MCFVEILEEFEIYGFSAKTSNLDETKSPKIAPLWDKFLQNYDGKSEIYCTYSDYESDVNGEYIFCIGTKSQSSLNLKISKVNSGKYIVFDSKFNNGNDTLNTWKQIWSFFENSNLIRAYKTDFERYFDGNLEIYIGIK